MRGRTRRRDGTVARRVERVVSSTCRRSSCRRLPVKIGARHIRADIAYGGAFYAIVDTEAAGLPSTPRTLPELRRIGIEIASAVEAHDDRAPARAGASRHRRHDLHRARRTTRRRPPECHRVRRRRSRSLAVRHGHVGGDGRARCDGLLGDDHAVRPREPRSARDSAGASPDAPRSATIRRSSRRSKASAWITGEHTFVVDERDPLKDGFSEFAASSRLPVRGSAREAIEQRDSVSPSSANALTTPAPTRACSPSPSPTPRSAAPARWATRRTSLRDGSSNTRFSTPFWSSISKPSASASGSSARRACSSASSLLTRNSCSESGHGRLLVRDGLSASAR